MAKMNVDADFRVNNMIGSKTLEVHNAVGSLDYLVCKLRCIIAIYSK